MGTYFKGLLAAALTVLFALPVASLSGPRCLCSREDNVPCMYDEELTRAGANEYTVHSTTLGNDCTVLLEGETKATITDLGTNETRVLYSPGFNTEDQYEKELKVEYKVECGEDDELAYYEFISLDLQREEDCETDDGYYRCQDYVQIYGTYFGAVEECGNATSSETNLMSGNFTVVFRTSEDDVVGDGFELYVTCYRPGEAMPGKKKRSDDDLQLATFYVDLFPNSGYPPHLEIRQDLAEFHQQWNSLRGDLTEIDVLHNQTVNYIQSYLHLMDLDGNILTRYYVRVLQTFNSDGVIERYVGGVTANRNPHFHGPGLVRIIDEQAYFQLFQFDPRGVVPNEEEKIELSTMRTPLLNFAKQQTPQEICSNYQADKRQIPRDANNLTFNETDREAVLAAFRSADSRNAVLRAQSRATLTFYSQRDPNYVERLRTFNITCSLNSRLLECTSDSVTIPGRTLCQTDDRSSVMCDPFRRYFRVARKNKSVTVTTVNSDGQTAVYEVIV